MKPYDFLLYFFVYGFLGWCVEVAFAAFKTKGFVNRGFLNGPVCPIYGIGVSVVIGFLTPLKFNPLLLYLASVILVTLLEGITGWGMDIIFHHKWWDYSGMPFNIGGYVCLLFSVLWGIACVLIVYLIHPPIAGLLSLLPVWLGWSIIAILGTALLADCYVTSAAIFKFNRHLARMEKIAEELHEISDQIGADIFEHTIRTIEHGELAQEKFKESKQKLEESRQRLDASRQKLEEAKQRLESESRQRLDTISDELLERIRNLKSNYRELEDSPNLIIRRLINAFPRLESKNHKQQLDNLKNKLKKHIKH